MKQKFKNDTLTFRKCVNSILRFYNQCTTDDLIDGCQWYFEAKQYALELADRYGLKVQQTAGILAVFSPQTTWELNKRYALGFLISPKSIVKNRTQTDKARQILSMENEDKIYNALSVNDKAFKTKAFFLNILNPDVFTSVTIDRHAIAICIQRPDNVYALSDEFGKLTAKQYDFFVKCYASAAAQLGIFPHQLQAITWIVYRRLRELPQHNNETQWQPLLTDVTF